MIEIRNIKKSFGSLEVLKGIDLDIEKGKIVSIVGPSGAGKTTLLQIMGTLDKADSGKVEIAYRNPTITVKVDNRTGKFVSGTCKWTYRVEAMLYSLDAKVLAFNVHLQNASGVIDYTVSY